MNYLIAIIVLLLAIPIGYLLRNMTKEELRKGKKYFKFLMILSVALIIVSLIAPLTLIEKQTAIFSLLFLIIISYISWK